MALRKAESEKQSREQNIRTLQDEMASQDEAIARINKEKKHQEEVPKQLILCQNKVPLFQKFLRNYKK